MGAPATRRMANPDSITPHPAAFDVAVMGGGASGLAAAIASARAGARTCVIERDVAAGLPILATGNGRCNVSNARLNPNRYRHPDWVRTVFGNTPERDVAAFFESIGLATVEEGQGRLYPLSRRAESVHDALLGACSREGVELITCAEPQRLEEDGEPRRLILSVPASPLAFKPGRDAKATTRNARKALGAAARRERPIAARAIVLACGGRSQDACRMLGVPHLEEEPLLCPIACSLDAARLGTKGHAPSLDKLDGLRAEGMLSLVRDGASIAFEPGEVLFRPYGISGIAAFNLSRRIRTGDLIEFDLFPDMNDRDLVDLLSERERIIGPYASDPAWFDGLIARPIALLATQTAAGCPQPLKAVATLLHHIPLRVSGTAEHAQAQVRRGGIPIDALDTSTLAVIPSDQPRFMALYACGEAIDVDADCGGYNLAWAWLSGLRAGSAAAAANSPLAH